MPRRVRRKKPSSVRTIKYQVTGGSTDDPPTCTLDTVDECLVAGKLKMALRPESHMNRIYSHLLRGKRNGLVQPATMPTCLLADLTASQYDKLRTREFLQSHRSARVDPRRADSDLRPKTELISVVQSR